MGKFVSVGKRLQMCTLVTGQVDRQHRGIAQSGSAPALGAGCREFESLYPDQIIEHGVSGIALSASGTGH